MERFADKLKKHKSNVIETVNIMQDKVCLSQLQFSRGKETQQTALRAGIK
jgi:hypothetical protein